MRHGGKKIVLWFLKISVSLGLIAFLLTTLDLQKTQLLLKRVSAIDVLVVFACLFGSLFFSSLRWKFLLAHLGIRLPVFESFKLNWIGIFYNMTLPGANGGDVYRAWVLSKEKKASIVHLLSSVLVERIAGASVILVLGAVSTAFLTVQETNRFGEEVVFTLQAVGFSVFFVGVTLYFSGNFFLKKKEIIETGDSSLSLKIKTTIRRALQLPLKAMVELVSTSTVKQLFEIFAPWAAALCIGVDIPLLYFFIVTPIAFLAIVLPISFGGVGVREGVFVFLFGRMGIAAEDAFLTSIFIYLSWIMIGVLGRFVFLGSRSRVLASKPDVIKND